MDAEIGIQKFGLIDVLLRVLDSAGRGKRRKAQSLKALADRKFSELEATHNLFIGLLKTLTEALQSATNRLASSDDIDVIRNSLVRTVLAVEEARFDGMDSRLGSFIEARVFSKRVLEDSRVLTTINVEIAESFRKFMLSYVNYFRSGNVYSHELARALAGVESSLLFSVSNFDRYSATKDDLRRRATDARIVTLSAIDASREKWADVVTDYHELNFMLLEQGLL